MALSEQTKPAGRAHSDGLQENVLPESASLDVFVLPPNQQGISNDLLCCQQVKSAPLGHHNTSDLETSVLPQAPTASDEAILGSKSL
jgi:hypothetical protein